MIMPQLFHTDFCLSGQCVCRLHMEACLIARELADEKNHIAEKRKAEELLNEGGRLLDEQEIHGTEHLNCMEGE
jgi:hypothetical protein